VIGVKEILIWINVKHAAYKMKKKKDIIELSLIEEELTYEHQSFCGLKQLPTNLRIIKKVGIRWSQLKRI